MSQSRGAKKRQGVSIAEYLSQPNKMVTRGELWSFLNYYEAKRRQASPLWRGWARTLYYLGAHARRIYNIFRPPRVGLDADAPMLNGQNEAIAPAETPLAPDTPPTRKVYDVNGRLVDRAS